MAKTPRYELDYADPIHEHIDSIEEKYHSMIEHSIEEQLRFQPTVATRNRKRLKILGPFGAEWELRCGPDNRIRVFYNVDEIDRIVSLKAVE